ncbi:potassium channel family protein [Mesorhizobium sp. M7A.F.Ca.US.002.01.1.1]|uniref:potassium channel family protein n=1 Tax=Mesorhizobium sp. M7A.F.Ca.US.002.01.1.1 TaxID=2496700 RepID=UPI001FDFC0C5|nr:potassium channel family protein [Mesorhizobium sp. M7A.F.Ca.US.002.01.1.1]
MKFAGRRQLLILRKEVCRCDFYLPRMVLNLLIGTVVISLTVLVHTFGLIAVTHAMGYLVARFRMHGRRSRIVAMISVVMGLFAVMTVEVWLWAELYRLLDIFADFETALYFSTITFSTVGYGDIVPAHQWRVLAALEGVNGFLLIGWSTAYLIAAGTRIGPFKAGEHF